MIKKLPTQPVLLTALALFAFAGNSLLCRLALKDTQIDALSFNTIRIMSGALTLWLIVVFKSKKQFSLTPSKLSISSALSLFIYASGFAFAYTKLSAATGALLLFGSVQFTMIIYAIWRGERLNLLQTFGLLISLSGVILLLLPNSTTPPLFEAGLMAVSGIAWGVYSILGKYAKDATKTAAQSFIFSLPLAVLLSMVFYQSMALDNLGVIYAITSGAITSGLGYAIWYLVLPHLTNTVAASAQLSVPALTAIGGALFINETITFELIVLTLIILGGIGLVTFTKSNTSN